MPIAIGPRISFISPDRRLVGTSAGGAIYGRGFTPSTTVQVTGYGVGVAGVTFNSNSELSVSFQITPDATAGNHAVTVTTAGLVSNSVNFFVQVPRSLQLAITGGLMTPVNEDVRDLGGHLVATNQCGVYRNYGYYLLDQQGQRIFDPFTIMEEFGGYNGPFPPPTARLGNIAAGSIVPDLQNVTFRYPRCLIAGEFESFLIGYNVLIGQTIYSLSTIVGVQRGNDNGILKVDAEIVTP
ncbi:MAG: hypothetical protein ABR577_13975 [Pyrinomonadaceae bacterium]